MSAVDRLVRVAGAGETQPGSGFFAQSPTERCHALCLSPVEVVEDHVGPGQLLLEGQLAEHVAEVEAAASKEHDLYGWHVGLIAEERRLDQVCAAL